MHQSYKFRIYPNYKQKIALAKNFGSHICYGNYSVNLCPKNYQSIENDLAKSCIQGNLPELKQKYLWQKYAYFQGLQLVCFNLYDNYKSYWGTNKQSSKLTEKTEKNASKLISYLGEICQNKNFWKLPFLLELFWAGIGDRNWHSEVVTRYYIIKK